MADEPKSKARDDAAPDELTAKVPIEPAQGKVGTVMLLPGLVAIGLYMLVLATVVTLGVVGGHYPPLFLIPAFLFVTASFGLLRLFRWAWALTLSAVFLLMSYHLWLVVAMKQTPSLVQAGLNLIFFFYLVRTEVRARLR